MEVKRVSVPYFSSAPSTIDSIDEDAQSKPRRKAFNNKISKSSSYVWASSIPQRWKDLKGNSYFLHISQTSRPKDTLEFLRESQKYIDEIRGTAKKEIELEDTHKSHKSLASRQSFMKKTNFTSPSHEIRSVYRNTLSPSIRSDDELYMSAKPFEWNTPKNVFAQKTANEHSPESLVWRKSKVDFKAKRKNKLIKRKNYSPDLSEIEFQLNQSPFAITPIFYETNLLNLATPHRLIPSGIATPRYANNTPTFLDLNLAQYLNRFEGSNKNAHPTPLINKNFPGRKLIRNKFSLNQKILQKL
ncbi:unnamed protein product [Blepharisma stoltei]|uniref:Uncharacterized protein n=1 Tax=Blepharisma stoltei TaxID=1481888 RepID=A0AAU9INY3_9CILI|nr:unnamed protein product [Blepharisma stoltei]